MKYPHIISIGLLCAIGAGAAFLAGAKKPSESTTTKIQNPVAEILQLTGDQTRDIQNADPKFNEESRKLAEELQTERHKLLELLQSDNTAATEINAQLEKTLAADAALERRVVNHLLVMRQHLTEPQSRQLMNLCDQCMCPNKEAGKGMGHGPMSREGPGPAKALAN